MTPWIVAHHTPLTMGFPRQEYWNGLHFPLQGILITFYEKETIHITLFTAATLEKTGQELSKGGFPQKRRAQTRVTN